MARTLTDEQKADLLGRGPVAELQLTPEDVEGLTQRERLSMSKKVAFLRAFAVRGIVLDGLKAAGVSRNLVNEYWKPNDEWFATLYDAALEEAADSIEAEAFRRAVTGYDEPVIFQGMPTVVVDKDTGEERNLTVRKYSDALMQTLLKGSRPEKYRDNHKVQHELPPGSTGVLIVPAAVDPKSWEQAAAEQQRKYAGNSGDEPKES